MIAAIWMSFEREQACVSNPRRRSSSCIIGLAKVSLKAMERRKTMNAVFRLHKSEENNYHSSRGHNKIIHVAVQVLVASVLLVIALCCSAHAVNIDATVPASLLLRYHQTVPLLLPRMQLFETTVVLPSSYRRSMLLRRMDGHW